MMLGTTNIKFIRRMIHNNTIIHWHRTMGLRKSNTSSYSRFYTLHN